MVSQNYSWMVEVVTRTASGSNSEVLVEMVKQKLLM
jgi:hypothetical protein